MLLLDIIIDRVAATEIEIHQGGRTHTTVFKL